VRVGQVGGQVGEDVRVGPMEFQLLPDLALDGPGPGIQDLAWPLPFITQ